MDGLLKTKPANHHDFHVEKKGDKVCTKCQGTKDQHVEYERVKVIGTNGNYLAWRAREGK